MSEPKNNDEQFNAEKAKAAEPTPMNDKPDYEHDVYERETATLIAALSAFAITRATTGTDHDAKQSISHHGNGHAPGEGKLSREGKRRRESWRPNRSAPAGPAARAGMAKAGTRIPRLKPSAYHQRLLRRRVVEANPRNPNQERKKKYGNHGN
jgi:hypothetical protein